jgi:hypothetical protein
MVTAWYYRKYWFTGEKCNGKRKRIGKTFISFKILTLVYAHVMRKRVGDEEWKGKKRSYSFDQKVKFLF